MEEPAKKSRDLENDQLDVGVNDCIFNFKIHLSTKPATTPATFAAQIN